MFDLSPAHQEARRDFRAFVAREIAPHAARADAEERLPSTLLDALGREGMLGAALSKAQGGRGLDDLALGLLHAEVGRTCASSRSLLTVQSMVARAIERWGSDAQKAQWLGRLACGEALAAFALTEPEAGSDLSALEARATQSGESYRLQGRKRWISFGQIAHVFLVFARCEDALSAFLVEPETPGFKRVAQRGLLGVRASMLADLTLDDCHVPLESRLGRSALPWSPIASSALDFGRYSVAWGAVGSAEACLRASLLHAQTRQQGGKALAEHQLVQRLLSRMIAGVRAARLVCLQAGARRDGGDPRALADTMIAKYLASTTASQVAADAVQIHGALGCAQGSLVERHFRDAKVMEIIEGSTQIHEIAIAQLASGAALDEEA